MELGLEGKRAIVTGSNRGIGRCCALALAREGVRVCVTARTRDLLDRTVKNIHAAGGEGHAVAQHINALATMSKKRRHAILTLTEEEM